VRLSPFDDRAAWTPRELVRLPRSRARRNTDFVQVAVPLLISRTASAAAGANVLPKLAAIAQRLTFRRHSRWQTRSGAAAKLSAVGAAGVGVAVLEGRDPVVAVVDASGAVFDVIQRCVPRVSLRRVTHLARAANGHKPTLAIFAVYGPSDWRRVETWSRIFPTVVVTVAEDEADPARARALGAFGLLHTGLSADAMRRAIVGALNGEPAYSRAALGAYIRAETSAAKGKRQWALTPRQREIVALIARGASDREIGHRLGITTSTTQKHVQALLRRLEVPNRAAAVAAILG
jgi:DNA-binding NarL/FixJ family response regulator